MNYVVLNQVKILKPLQIAQIFNKIAMLHAPDTKQPLVAFQ